MRRSDPERIHLAKLAGLRNRIRDAWRVPIGRVDEVLADWSAEAEVRKLVNSDTEYWSQAERWIEDQLGRQSSGGR